MKVLFTSLILLFFCTLSFGQRPDRQADYWLFGAGAGVFFPDGGEPVSTSGLNQMTTERVSMVYTNKDGELLMYTNSSKVWNKQGEVVDGAEKLIESSDPLFPGVIIPIPEQENQFYVFSIDNTAGNNIEFPIYYHRINMNANGGEGSKVGSFDVLTPGASFGVTTVKHCNNKDYWLITHSATGNDFLVYLVDKNGINKSDEIVSSLGTPFSGSSFGQQQEIVASEDGSVLAISKPEMPEGGFVELFDFDNETGEVTKVRTTLTGQGSIKGLALSPDGKLVYISRLKELIPVNANTTESVFEVVQYRSVEAPAFRVVIKTNSYQGGVSGDVSGTFLVEPGAYGNLKLGPNGKIYLSHIDASFLSVIHQPNELGSDSDFEYANVNLGSKKAKAQLPATIAPDYLSFEVSLVFEGDSTICNPILEAKTEGMNLSGLEYQWYLDGEEIDGSTNKTKKATSSGDYSVLAMFGCQEVKSEFKYVFVPEDLPAPLTDTTYRYCQGDKVEDLVAVGSDIKWYADEALLTVVSNEESLTPAINGDNVNSETYFVTQSDGNCESEASEIQVEVLPYEIVSLSDSLLSKCFASDGPYELSLTEDISSGLEWFYNGELISNENTLLLDSYGTYSVQSINEYCRSADTVKVQEVCLGIYFATAFSPNGNGDNDEFLLKGSGVFEFDYEIVNLYGRVLKSGTNMKFDNNEELSLWDGMYGGKDAPVGTYHFIFEARIEGPLGISTLSRTGSIVLIR